MFENPLYLLIEAGMALISILSTIAYISHKLGRLEVKVDTLWDFMVRRATSEAVIKGAGSLNSPFILSEVARSWFALDLQEKLQNDYIEFWMGKEDKEIFLEIEKKYGERLLKEVCIPNHLFSGACVMAAIEISKGH